MTVDTHGNPIPPSREERARSWVAMLMLPLAVFMAGAGWGLIQASITQPPPSVGPPSPSADPSLAVIAASLSRMAASTPQPFPREIVMLPPPSPTPRLTATPDPNRPTKVPGVGPCPDRPETLPTGTVCRWVVPMPTPTPMLPCSAPPIPGEACVVTRSVYDQTPTP